MALFLFYSILVFTDGPKRGKTLSLYVVLLERNLIHILLPHVSLFTAQLSYNDFFL